MIIIEIKILKTSAEADKERKVREELIRKVVICPECGHEIKLPEPKIREDFIKFLDPNWVDYYDHYVEVNAYEVYDSKCDECGCEWRVTSDAVPKISKICF